VSHAQGLAVGRQAAQQRANRVRGLAANAGVHLVKHLGGGGRGARRHLDGKADA
jgi:hypothetical protein